MAQQPINFDPSTGDDTTGALRKADNNIKDHEQRLAALGNASAKNVGTTAGTVAAGDDSRITGAMPATNPEIVGTAGIIRRGVQNQMCYRVYNLTQGDAGIGGGYADWNANLTPALQVDCQSNQVHYMGMRWTHWGVRHLAAIHAYEGGPGSNVSMIGFHFDGTSGVNRHQFRGDGNATFAGTLTQNSDYRIKADLTSLDAISVSVALRSLRPIEYTDTRLEPGSARRVGFVAHELQAELPLLVEGAKDAVSTGYETVGDTTPYIPGTEPDGYVPPHQVEVQVPVLQNVNYIGMAPYLTAGWQAHDARLAAIETEVAALRAQVEALLVR